MNGNRLLLDTNAIAALLQGNLSLVELLKTADWIGISVISEIEFLANPDLNENDIVLFENFVSRIEVIDLRHIDIAYLESILDVRKKSKIKLPDAIIAATTLINKAKLITSDAGFRKVARLKIIEFY
jgi:tRNA(fMet)-specific endonuclease VapC